VARVGHASVALTARAAVFAIGGAGTMSREADEHRVSNITIANARTRG
jgi:hypothetical protein